MRESDKMRSTTPHKAVAVPETPQRLTAEMEPSDAAAVILSFDNDFCVVSLYGNNTAKVSIDVESEVMRRIRSRAGTQNLADYVWDNILKRALYDHVY